MKLDPNLCMNQSPDTDVKNMEREFWGTFSINKKFFFGGTLGKSRGGVTTMAVS